MFWTIFSFEVKRWLKTWQFYLYAGLFFFLGFFLMGSSLGYFDAVTVTTTSLRKMNSPLMIAALIEGTNQLLYFLFPTIIGAGIYRDFKYNAHHIFFSYPFTKTSYLMGKFWSGFLVSLWIAISIGLGIYVATILPMANPELLGPTKFWNYAQAYFLNVIPNMLLMGAIVFVVTTLSRSVYTGFVTTIALVIIMGVVSSLGGQLENKVLAALIDPSGMNALDYYVEYWTIDEYNTKNLPIGKYFLLNRGIWLTITALFLLALGRFFQFSQQGIDWVFWRKPKAMRMVKNNFGGLFKIELPKVNYDFSIKTQMANALQFAKMDFNYLVKNRVLQILMGIGVLIIILENSLSGSIMGTKALPVTANMLLNEFTFYFFLITITFLAAGLLIHRSQLARMSGLTDSTAAPNWVFFTSKYLALILLQISLLMLVMLSSVLFQTFQGYFHFEIGLYLRRFLGISLFGYVIWAGLALAVQTAFKNYIVGFFVLLVFFLFGSQYSKLGVEQAIFFFNRLPGVRYSDLNGFSSNLPRFYIFASYWLLFIGFISGLNLLFWRRGIFSGLKERFTLARERATKSVVLPSVLCLIGFLGLGGYLYYENTVLHPYYSKKDRELQQVDFERTYKKYENWEQPRISAVKINVDLYPKTRDFVAAGVFTLKNKSGMPIDSLLVNYNPDLLHTLAIENAEFVRKDSVQGVLFYRFNQALNSGATADLTFTIKNKPNTWLRNNSPVLNNGTFINNFSFPSIGYDAAAEISNAQLREKYNLPPKERIASQDDKKARQNTYLRKDSDWITFETTVSTSEDQIAIAPGYLQKEWTDNGRRYFHYTMGNQKILNFYAFNSGRYEVMRDQWKDINLEIYYNKSHPFNLDRMMKGLKKGMDYFTREFGPFQFEQARIIEFPATQGNFAQSFANTIPFSEGMGFIADVDDEADKIDYPFAITAHELAHQWWGHQVVGANVQGSTMLSESLAEYSSLKVLEHEYGKNQMRKFLKYSLDRYLINRRFESIKEKPLMYNENQQYIHYPKGSLVFYAMSDYLGEEKLNRVLRGFIQKTAFQEAPYTTAGELVNDLREATPDSLQYLITDMFKTITLYDNYVEEATYKELDENRYKIDLKAIVSKYRSGEKGERSYVGTNGDSLVYTNKKEQEVKSLPLNDYVEVAVFGQRDAKTKENEKEGKLLYLKKHHFSEIENDLQIEVTEKPYEVGIDPYNKLIDVNSDDNRRKIKLASKEEP